MSLHSGWLVSQPQVGPDDSPPPLAENPAFHGTADTSDRSCCRQRAGSLPMSETSDLVCGREVRPQFSEHFGWLGQVVQRHPSVLILSVQISVCLGR
jgi:hypothetical protein